MKLYKKLSLVLTGILSATIIGTGTLTAGVASVYADEAEYVEATEVTAETEITESEADSETDENEIPTRPSEEEIITESDSAGVGITNKTEAAVNNGFSKSGNIWYYYINGKVSTVSEDIVYGTINGVTGWYYIANGKADLTKTSVEHNIHGWWYIKNGKVDFSYNGFAQNKHGWWYIENGKVTFKKSEVTYGTVNGVTAWWNVKGSQVFFNESIEWNRHGWWYVKDGKVDFTKTSVEHNEHGWWYVKNGKVIFSYNGFAQNKHGWWYIENGKVTFKKSEVTYGTVSGVTAWWNVRGSQVIFNESVEWNRYGWWYVKDGKVDFSYNGVAKNQHGTWYIVNGKVDFSANGWKTFGNNKYYIVNGKVTQEQIATSAEINSLSGKNYTIAPKTTIDYIFDISGVSIDPGANVQLYNNTATTNNHRRFRFEKQSDGTFKIVALHSELALGVSNGNVVQALNNNSDAIRWEIIKNSDNTYSFKNKSTGTYISMAAVKSGGNITTSKTGTSNNEKFKLYETSYGQTVANGCYKILTGNGSYAFDIAGARATNATEAQSYANNSSAAQLFKIEYVGNGYYTIKTGASIYASAIDVPNSNFAAGTKLQQYTVNGANAQKWRILTNGTKYVFLSAGGRFSIDVTGGTYSGGRLQLASYSKPAATNTFTLQKTSGWLIRNGRKYYFNQNGQKPMIGIDVSAWQETIDWDKVKADGIDFAIIRTAHRKTQVDPYGQRNMSECERLGIPYGVYFYSLATTNAEADAEANLFISSVKGHNPQLGLFVDVEDNTTYKNAFGDIYSASARRKITDIAKRMVSKITAAGYKAGIYGNESYLNEILYINELPEVRWVARYYTNTSSDTNLINLGNMKYKIWQFTDTGKVNGVNGNADLDTLIEKYW